MRIVKDNAPGLLTDIAAGFGFEAAAPSLVAAFSPEDPLWLSPGRVARTGDDRVEKRTLRTTTLLTRYQLRNGLAYFAV